jgi:5-methylcytosine-specific restriction protein A
MKKIDGQFYHPNKEPKGSKRSNLWPSVRKEYLSHNPVCEMCGGKKRLNVHHKKPFHLHPDLELNPKNLITLCEANPEVNCHLFIGHLGNFKGFNPVVVKDAALWKKKMAESKKRIKK